ncbi:putative methyltransferase-domain-containing protein [Pyronema domesticum]|nr:putative methyltransferase-domain-containing protein [Pyronema domesticum]
MDLFGDGSFVGDDLVAPAPIMEAKITSADFGLLEKPILIHEDLAKGCGGMIWPAGEVLTKWVLKKYMGTTELRGKRIVELGAGGGITSLAVAVGCDLEGADLYMTDMKAMYELMKDNVKLNKLEDKIKVELLDWANPVPDAIAEKPVDIILAADCVYFEPAFPLLEKTLVDMVGENTVVFFCFKRRRRADLHFVKAIRKRLHIVEVDINNDPDYEAFKRENLFL